MFTRNLQTPAAAWSDAPQVVVEVPLSRLTQEERAGLVVEFGSDLGQSVTVQQALRDLPRDHARIVSLRFGLGGTGPHTIAELATELGQTPAAVRNNLNAALRQLRHPRPARRLRDYARE